MTNQPSAATSVRPPTLPRPKPIGYAHGAWVAALTFTTLSLIRGIADPDSCFVFPAVFLGLAVVAVQLVFVQRMRCGHHWARVALTVIAACTVVFWLGAFVQHLPSPLALFDLFVPVALIVATALLWSRAANDYFGRSEYAGELTGD